MPDYMIDGVALKKKVIIERKFQTEESANGVYTVNFGDWNDKYELPNFSYFVKMMHEQDVERQKILELRLFLDLESSIIWSTGSAICNELILRSNECSRWLYDHVQTMLRTGYYDYINLYNPECATAVYAFMEIIDLDFSDMSEDDDYYPFGWINLYEYFEKIGVKLPSYNNEEGKYNKSIHWE